MAHPFAPHSSLSPSLIIIHHVTTLRVKNNVSSSSNNKKSYSVYVYNSQLSFSFLFSSLLLVSSLILPRNIEIYILHHILKKKKTRMESEIKQQRQQRKKKQRSADLFPFSLHCIKCEKHVVHRPHLFFLVSFLKGRDLHVGVFKNRKTKKPHSSKTKKTGKRESIRSHVRLH